MNSEQEDKRIMREILDRYPEINKSMLFTMMIIVKDAGFGRNIQTVACLKATADILASSITTMEEIQTRHMQN